MQPNEFGQLLKKYRLSGVDPDSGGKLTQERLAELLDIKAGIVGYSGVRVSNWERGEEVIGQEKRDLLVGLLLVLYLCRGIKTLAEADDLLFSGNYRYLDENEAAQINEDWRKSKQVVRASFHEDIPQEPNIRLTITQQLFGKLGKVFPKIANQKKETVAPTAPVQMYSSACGDKGIDLGKHRLLISTAFGTYFAGLLERDGNHILLENQIQCPVPQGQEKLLPIERIFWAFHYPKGPRMVIIAAEGGMGKSTLAAKIARCLSEEQIVDMVLGDSAKSQQMDLLTGKIQSLDQGYYDPLSCYQRLCSQLGVPFVPDQESSKSLLTKISDRLVGRRALIILDNLETIDERGELIRGLTRLINKDVRILITTRQLNGITPLTSNLMTVTLNPLIEPALAKRFLHWHVDHFGQEHTALQTLTADLENLGLLNLLIQRTGGIPLLMQLFLSDVTRYSWAYLEQIPHIYGHELLNYLYATRWAELHTLQDAGRFSQELLHWLANEQRLSRKVSFARLSDWSQTKGRADLLAAALELLHERFLIINQDNKHGNFVLFPSLVQFLYGI